MPIRKIESFFSQFKILSFKAREIILRADTPPSGIFYLKKGYVKDYSISTEGEELTLIIFKPGDFFPVQWAINDKPNIHNLEALTAVELYRVPKDRFIDFLTKNPDVLFELTRRIVTRLGGLLDRMEHLVFGNAYEKIGSILLILAERFGEKNNNHFTIPLILTHKDIAALAGMTRETVSIEMKKLESNNLIAYNGRLIIVKNPDKLRRESLVERITS